MKLAALFIIYKKTNQFKIIKYVFKNLLAHPTCDRLLEN